MYVKCHNSNCDVSIKEDAKSPPVFPQWPGTAVSAGTSSAEAGLGSGLIVLSAVTGAGHCTRLSRPELATQIYTAMNIGHFWLRLQELKEWPSVPCGVDVQRTLSSSFSELTESTYDAYIQRHLKTLIHTFIIYSSFILSTNFLIAWD